MTEWVLCLVNDGVMAAYRLGDLPPKFTGYVQINCVDGGVAAVTRLETEKPPRKIMLDKEPRILIAIKALS